MSGSKEPSYRNALDAADVTWSPAVGLRKEGIVSLQDIAKQNNTIIELLVSIHRRLSLLEQKALPDLSLKTELGEISSKITNLVIGEKPNTVKKGTGVIAVWEDPYKQIESYKKKYGPKPTESTSSDK